MKEEVFALPLSETRRGHNVGETGAWNRFPQGVDLPSNIHDTFRGTPLSRSKAAEVGHSPVEPILVHQSEEPPGRRYFQTREMLNHAVRGLCALGPGNGIASGRITELANASAELETPFLFVLIGETGAGKSTLIKALFAGECVNAALSPVSGRTSLLRYGAESRESDFPEDIVDVFRPIKFLKDFNFLTLPREKGIGSSMHAITEQFLPEADLIFFVISVTKPWADQTWEFLDSIHRKWHRKIVFVILQCDRRTGEEVAAISEHAQKIARHRYGRQFPTFTVSAKMALLAKSAAHDQAELYHQSGIEPLRRHLSAVVESSAPRLVKLIHTCLAAREALKEFKVRLRFVSEIIHSDEETISRLESAARIQMERILEKHKALLDEFDRSFVSAALQTEPLLDAVFRFTSIMQPRSNRIAVIEDLISTITLKSVRDGIGSDATVITDDLDRLYRKVSARVSELPNWDAPRRRFSESIEEATVIGLSEMNLGDKLSTLFIRSRRLIWGCLISSFFLGVTGVTLTLLHRGFPSNAADLLVELAVGVIFTMLEKDLWNAVALTSALVCLIAAATLSARLVNRAGALYHSILDLNRERISKLQRGAFGKQMPTLYRDFNAPVEELRKGFREHRGKHEAMLRKIEKLESSLAEVERVLHPIVRELISRDCASRKNT